MVELSKATIQQLAVLRALSMWQRGAYGPVRLHKILFFADKENDAEWRLFTFKKWHLGQYSDEVAESLNRLRATGRISCVFDGPAERIRAEISAAAKGVVFEFFREYFVQWHVGLEQAFPKWAYLNNDTIIRRAHDDPSYTRHQHRDEIFPSFSGDAVLFEGLDPAIAERLADLVDVRLHRGIEKQMAAAVQRPVKGEDWRTIYFGEKRMPNHRTVPA
jgi:hypothetical protein